MMTGAARSGDGISVTAAMLIAQRSHVRRPATTEQVVSALPGGFMTRRRGNGQVIADSRAYVEGDDIRHVDRGATARTGKLHIRTFHEERDRVSFLVADFRPSMLWGVRRALRSVAAAEALARLGWRAVETGGRVGLLAITPRGALAVPTRGRSRGMLAVVGGLVKAHATALEEVRDGLHEAPLDRALMRLKRIVPRGAIVVIASALDTRGDAFDEVIGDLAQRRHPRFLIAEDHALRELPPGYYPMATPDGTRFGGTIGQNLADRRIPVSVDGYPAQFFDTGAEISDAVLSLGQ